MGKVAYLLAGLLLCAVSMTAQTVEHLYSPGTNLERSELAQLETATRSVDLAMYSFTDRYLAEELAALASRGVRVRVYRDREQFAQEMQRGGITTTGMLLAAGIEVRVKGAKDLMHLKSYAIDGRLLRSGSANWSPTGLKQQDNDLCTKPARSPCASLSGSLRRCGHDHPIRPPHFNADSLFLRLLCYT